jgi:hypothetical protein
MAEQPKQDEVFDEQAEKSLTPGELEEVAGGVVGTLQVDTSLSSLQSVAKVDTVSGGALPAAKDMLL